MLGVLDCARDPTLEKQALMLSRAGILAPLLFRIVSFGTVQRDPTLEMRNALQGRHVTRVQMRLDPGPILTFGQNYKGGNHPYPQMVPEEDPWTRRLSQA